MQSYISINLISPNPYNIKYIFYVFTKIIKKNGYKNISLMASSLPTLIKKFTVPSSPNGHKKAQSQIQLKVYKTFLYISNITLAIRTYVQYILTFILKNILTAVKLQLKESALYYI